MFESHDFILTESLYLYKKVRSDFYKPKEIERLFTALRGKKNAPGNNIIAEAGREPIATEMIDGTDFRISALCFSFKEKVPFLSTAEAPDELKYAYLCLLDFGDYLAVTKRNLTLQGTFIASLEGVPHEVLSRCFISPDTRYESIRTTSLSRSENAIRNKSYSANDLSEALPATGNSTDALSSMRLTDGADRLGITLSTSRISGYSKTDNFAEFIHWVYQIKEQVSNYHSCESNDFLNGFASPSSYEQQHAKLLPIGLVVMWEKLLTDISQKRITKITHNDETISDNFEQILKLSSEMLDLHATSSPIRYEAIHEIFGALQIKKNKKYISLLSAKMEQYIIHFDGDESMTLLAYLNAHHCFVVFFRERCMTYHAKTLYKDAQLPIRMKQFMEVFEALPTLEHVTSEKGELSDSSTEFSTGSEFRLVEDTFADEYDYFICDDLGLEWGDHIGISDKRISIFASKFKELPTSRPNARISVSKLHDVVAQAQKSIAFLNPSPDKLDKKAEHWAKNYGKTQIPLLRRGESADKAVAQWKETTQRLGVSLQMNIVINTLSKSTVEGYFQQFKEAEESDDANLDPSILQLVWLVSGLYTTCQSNHAELRILCRP